MRAFNEENGSFLATTYIIFSLSIIIFFLMQSKREGESRRATETSF